MDAEAWDERYAASDLVWSASPNQFVAAELAALPPGLALDVACVEPRTVGACSAAADRDRVDLRA